MSDKITTAPEAYQTAEDLIEIEKKITEAVREADGVEEAQNKARTSVQSEVKAKLELRDTPEQIIEDVQDDLGWQAAKDAKVQYMKENIEEFK